MKITRNHLRVQLAEYDCCEEDLNYHLLATRVYKLQTLITAITVGNGFTKRSKFRKF